MNSIEAMMEKFGVKKKPNICWSCLKETTCPWEGCEPDLKIAPLTYPSFTPEKQLGVIRILSQTMGVLIKEDCIFTGFEHNNKDDLVCLECKDFGVALAALLITKFDLLLTSQRQRIRKILENEK